MKLLITLLLLISFKAYSDSEATCQLTNGIYQNSRTPLTEMKFETLADIFTIKNANTLSMNLDGNQLRAIRTSLDYDRQTKIIFLQKKKDIVVRAIHMLIDRTPRAIAKDREFYGNMLISAEMQSADDWRTFSNGQMLRYNFYCKF